MMATNRTDVSMEPRSSKGVHNQAIFQKECLGGGMEDSLGRGGGVCGEGLLVLGKQQWEQTLERLFGYPEARDLGFIL